MGHTREQARAYWYANLRLLAILLFIWGMVSFGFGIYLADWLNQFHLGGYPIGLFFAQQGSIYTFVMLIFVYVWKMKRLDRRYGVED